MMCLYKKQMLIETNDISYLAKTLDIHKLNSVPPITDPFLLPIASYPLFTYDIPICTEFHRQFSDINDNCLPNSALVIKNVILHYN